ncbi:uncharacterized protein LOC141854468 [Brevipalpus obovatus]|uniref:uncharacterized protein LOC141854468 n=1 Tax=Brevipalpus obovatus TaxID=246614 RepID=UPI003D9E478F
MMQKIVNLRSWISHNLPELKPPVCNKMIFDNQLKMFLVNGPNERSDFHINMGEEIFIMIQGNMVLKIIDDGSLKDIIIKEGELFVLPANVPHSPQRPPKSIGLVIERERTDRELDCLRYYSDDGSETIFQRWFRCENLATDLIPIIQEFKLFKENNSIIHNGVDRCGSNTDDFRTKYFKKYGDYDSIDPQEPSPLYMEKPIRLSNWLGVKLLIEEEVVEGMMVEEDEDNSEDFFALETSFSLIETREVDVGIYRTGFHTIVNCFGDMLLWHHGSRGEIRFEDKCLPLSNQDCILLSCEGCFTLYSRGPTIAITLRKFCPSDSS